MNYHLATRDLTMFYFCFECEQTTIDDELISEDIDGTEVLFCPFCDSEDIMQIDSSDGLYT